MAISTRNKASKKAFNRSKVTVRPRTSQRNPPTIQVPATPSQGTITPEMIEDTQPEPPNDDDRLRRLLAQELAKIGQRQPDSQPEAPHDEKLIGRLLQRLLAKAKDKKDDSDSQDSSRVRAEGPLQRPTSFMPQRSRVLLFVMLRHREKS